MQEQQIRAAGFFKFSRNGEFRGWMLKGDARIYTTDEATEIADKEQTDDSQQKR